MRIQKSKQTPKRPHVRSLKIQPKIRISTYYKKKIVPEIKLCGNWLQELGFESGAQVTVTTMPNLLIIRTE